MNTEDIKDEEVKNTPEVEKTTAEATAEANIFFVILPFIMK